MRTSTIVVTCPVPPILDIGKVNDLIPSASAILIIQLLCARNFFVFPRFFIPTIIPVIFSPVVGMITGCPTVSHCCLEVNVLSSFCSCIWWLFIILRISCFFSSVSAFSRRAQYFSFNPSTYFSCSCNASFNTFSSPLCSLTRLSTCSELIGLPRRLTVVSSATTSPANGLFPVFSLRIDVLSVTA